ncbi:hypothetical protein [Spirosoma endbachense]|uniref:Curlin n=1 Tax=Spirosoma endbachense TaxID=2666025 RepID=A0A6P1VTW0_9BACT|nr:hypothetical protein [Spirosoma endbachense]QHV95532.1 hypothetical protein GJR95_11195 [Spirosoma endbachense]
MIRHLLTFCLGIIALSASAQSDAFWKQTGTGTNTLVQQAIVSGNVTAGSTVLIDQAGTGNKLLTSSQGSANAMLLRQTGNQNQLELNLIGNGNHYTVDQIGNQNVLTMPDVRSNNVDVQLIQRGDGNQLIREGSLSVGVPMRIEQTGGMKVILTNNHF